MSSYTIGPSLVPPDSFRIALAQASLTNTWLVAEYSVDYPYAGRPCDYLFLSDRCPHNIIIVLPSCTLRIYLLPDLFLTRYMLRVPLMLEPIFFCHADLLDLDILDPETGLMLHPRPISVPRASSLVSFSPSCVLPARLTVYRTYRLMPRSRYLAAVSATSLFVLQYTILTPCLRLILTAPLARESFLARFLRILSLLTKYDTAHLLSHFHGLPIYMRVPMTRP